MQSSKEYQGEIRKPSSVINAKKKRKTIERERLEISSRKLELPWELSSSLIAQSVESACNAGDLDWIPGLGRSPGEGNGNPLQYSCLENPMDRGAWQAIVHGVTRVRHDLATKPPPHGNISCKDGHNKGQKWYGPNRS